MDKHALRNLTALSIQSTATTHGGIARIWPLVNQRLKNSQPRHHRLGGIVSNQFANFRLIAIICWLALSFASSTIVQAAIPLSDAAMAQPIKGLSKFNTMLVSQVQQAVQQPVSQQQRLQSQVANMQTAQLNLSSLYTDEYDRLRLERLLRLSTQTREQLTPNDLFVAEIEANTLLRLAIDSFNILDQEIGVQNVKGSVVVMVQLNP